MVKISFTLSTLEYNDYGINNHDSTLAKHIFTAIDYLIIRETEMSSLFVSVNAHLTFRRRKNHKIA